MNIETDKRHRRWLRRRNPAEVWGGRRARRRARDSRPEGRSPSEPDLPGDDLVGLEDALEQAS
jgi:hypothetical protein